MRIAAFNVENLFDRPRAFNDEEESAQRTLKAAAELNALFEEAVYSEADKARMLELFEVLELNRFNDGPRSRIRKIRGRIVRRPEDGPPEIVASGREDWIGWLELETAPVDEVALLNTGRVIRDVRADVMAVVEAEDRVSLEKFVDFVFRRVNEELPAPDRPDPYAQVMLVDGNDDRGIDVGLMTKAGFDIQTVQSHIHDQRPDGTKVFSRDCPEYLVLTPGGHRLWVLPNHFKSKFGGNSPASVAKRRAQAARTAEIYDRLRRAGEQHIVVLGDFNDTPDSDPLQPLLTDTDLRDVGSFEPFLRDFHVDDPDNRGRGTYKLGNDRDKIDYLMLSPALFERLQTAGIFRKGAWPGSRPPRWEVYPTLTDPVHAASDHHVIWADVDLP